MRYIVNITDEHPCSSLGPDDITEKVRCDHCKKVAKEARITPCCSVSICGSCMSRRIARLLLHIADSSLTGWALIDKTCHECNGPLTKEACKTHASRRKAVTIFLKSQYKKQMEAKRRDAEDESDEAEDAASANGTAQPDAAPDVASHEGDTTKPPETPLVQDDDAVDYDTTEDSMSCPDGTAAQPLAQPQEHSQEPRTSAEAVPSTELPQPAPNNDSSRSISSGAYPEWCGEKPHYRGPGTEAPSTELPCSEEPPTEEPQEWQEAGDVDDDYEEDAEIHVGHDSHTPTQWRVGGDAPASAPRGPANPSRVGNTNHFYGGQQINFGDAQGGSFGFSPAQMQMGKSNEFRLSCRHLLTQQLLAFQQMLNANMMGMGIDPAAWNSTMQMMGGMSNGFPQNQFAGHGYGPANAQFQGSFPSHSFGRGRGGYPRGSGRSNRGLGNNDTPRRDSDTKRIQDVTDSRLLTGVDHEQPGSTSRRGSNNHQVGQDAVIVKIEAEQSKSSHRDVSPPGPNVPTGPSANTGRRHIAPTPRPTFSGAPTGPRAMRKPQPNADRQQHGHPPQTYEHYDPGRNGPDAGRRAPHLERSRSRNDTHRHRSRSRHETRRHHSRSAEDHSRRSEWRNRSRSPEHRRHSRDKHHTQRRERRVSSERGGRSAVRDAPPVDIYAEERRRQDEARKRQHEEKMTGRNGKRSRQDDYENEDDHHRRRRHH